MVVNASECEFGWKAKDFNLLSVEDKFYSLQLIKGKEGTVIVFICNHCPYVIAISKRLSFEAKELKKMGVNTIAIMSNDTKSYPEDSFDNMKKFSHKYNFNFLHNFFDISSATFKAFSLAASIVKVAICSCAVTCPSTF